MAAVITNAAATRATIPARPVFSVSPSTTTPSTAATTGCDICKVGIDAVSGPARNADWLHATPPTATRMHAYSSGVRVTAPGLGILLDRGYPIVCGVPTQTAMYDGFGAGVSSYSHTYAIDRRFAKLRDKPGRIRAREVNAVEARRHLPELYERWCAATNGAISRDDAWWADSLDDRPTQRGNGSALHYTIHPDGFLTYRVVGSQQHAFRPPLGTVVVEDFCPITDEAHTELLQTLLVLEMFYRIEIDAPPDDPLPLKLVDLRAAETTGVSDFLWVRINDVPETLGARTYRADADIVLEVTDPLGLAGGRFQLQICDGAGKCTPHDGSPDIEIGLANLATIYMGAHRASQLARANRITEVRQGALGELDAAFGTDRTPFCGTVL